MRDQRREERRGERLPGGGNESGLGLGGRAAGAGAYIAQPPTGGSPPQRDDPTVTGGAGGGCGVPIGPPPCLTGRGRASPCRRFCRAGPVLVPWALIAAQARPGAWHGHGTGPRGHMQGRVWAVLSRAVPVPAQRARPSWPPIQYTHLYVVPAWRAAAAGPRTWSRRAGRPWPPRPARPPSRRRRRIPGG